MAEPGSGLACGTRYGDSRMPMAPRWGFGSDERPPVGTSKTYMGAEIAKQNDSIIGGLSPGPMYAPRPGPRSGMGGHEPPKYTFGEKRPILGLRDGPGPGPGNVPFNALGKQRINSSSESAPMFGMGTSTRDHMERVDLSRHHVSNNCVANLIGEPIDYSRAADKFAAERAAALKAAEPSRTSLARALAVAMAASANDSDPKLSAALKTVQSRVATLSVKR